MDLQRILSRRLHERFGGQWCFSTQMDPLSRETFVTITWYRDGIGISEKTIKESDLVVATSPGSVVELVYQAAVSLVPDEVLEEEAHMEQMLKIVGEPTVDAKNDVPPEIRALCCDECGARVVDFEPVFGAFAPEWAATMMEHGYCPSTGHKRTCRWAREK